MKLRGKGISPAGNEILELHLGVDEAKLILGLVLKAQEVYPRGDDWKPDSRRLDNMSKCLMKYFREDKPL
jgi:hypothetical protein